MNISFNKDMKRNAGKAAQLLKVLAHKERLMILCQLLGGEQCVSDLCNKSRLSQSAFSQHLAVLRQHGLVTTRKDAQTVFYSLVDDDSTEILKSLHKIYCKS